LKLLIIYNPHAGHGKARKLLSKVKAYLELRSIDFQLQLTEYQGHACEIAENADFSQFQGIIACGGDGTVFEVLNGYQRNSAINKPVMGIIPNGTGNAFVRDMEYQPGDWKKGIDTLLNASKKMIDVGKFTTANETYYFINILGFGFISDVNEESIKYKWMGNFAYILAVFTALIRLKSYPLQIEIDGELLQRDNIFVEISNSRYTGTTFLMAPQAELDDGFLDVTLLNKVNRRRILKVFPTIFSGKHKQFEEVEVFKAKKIKVLGPKNMKLSPDGELLAETPFEVECLQQQLTLFWPQHLLTKSEL